MTLCACCVVWQVYYTAKVVPSTVQRREAVQARNTYFALDVPERVMLQMQVWHAEKDWFEALFKYRDIIA